jgi:ketosteroid isomerase-like protein
MARLFFSTICISILFIAFSCSSKNYPAANPQAIMDADIAFSDMSKEKGMKAAFLQYIDENGVLLRQRNYPIVGNAAVEYLKKQNDSGFILTWVPEAAELAKSGDLGYTYGLYTLVTQDTTMHGTYVSIWKKQKDGSWKFVLDTGNQGLGKK